MAIAFDNSNSAQSATNASTLSYSLTVGAALANSKLVVGVIYYLLSVSVQSITYNGVNLKPIRRDNNGAQNSASELWYLDGPASGANTVLVTLTGVVGGSSIIASGAYSFSGVKAGSPEAQNGSIVTGTHTAHSDSVTTLANNAWIVDCLAENSGAVAPTANGSQAHVQTQTTTGNGCLGMSTLGPVTPAGSTSVGWTFASSGNATSHSAASFAPYADLTDPVFTGPMGKQPVHLRTYVIDAGAFGYFDGPAVNNPQVFSPLPLIVVSGFILVKGVNPAVIVNSVAPPPITDPAFPVSQPLNYLWRVNERLEPLVKQVSGATIQRTDPIPPVSQPLNYLWRVNDRLEPLVKRFEGATTQATFPVPPVSQPLNYLWRVQERLEPLVKQLTGATIQATFPILPTGQPLIGYPIAIQQPSLWKAVDQPTIAVVQSFVASPVPAAVLARLDYNNYLYQSNSGVLFVVTVTSTGSYLSIMGCG